MNLSSNGPFQIPHNNLNNIKSDPYESYKTNLISKYRLKEKKSIAGSSDGEFEILE